MTNDIPCPSCRRRLRLPDAVLGQVVRCPSCQATFTATLDQPAAPDNQAAAAASSPREEIVRDPETPAAAPNVPPWKVGPDDRDEDYPVIDTRPGARSQVAGPANALMTVGILALVLTGLGMFVSMIDNSKRLGRGGLSQEDLVLNCISLALGFLWGGLVTGGAVRMKKLESFGMAMTACIVAMLPCNTCCILGLPFGIWGLVVLNRPEVKSAFR